MTTSLSKVSLSPMRRTTGAFGLGRARPTSACDFTVSLLPLTQPSPENIGRAGRSVKASLSRALRIRNQPLRAPTTSTSTRTP